MSMIVSDSKSVVTVNSSARKMITGINVAGIIRSILPPELSDSDVIRTRNIKLSYEMAHNAVTGHKSPVAFVQGFAFCIVAFSHGNKNLSQLSENAPDWTKLALTHACQYFKAGAGNITAESLIIAVDSAIKAVLACPAPESKKAIKSPSTVVIDSTATRVDDFAIAYEYNGLVVSGGNPDTTGRAKSHSLAFGHEFHEDSIRAADSAIIQAGFSAREQAEKAAQEKAAQEDVDIVRIIEGLAINRPEFALAQLQEAAAILGYRLARIPAKKAA